MLSLPSSWEDTSGMLSCPVLPNDADDECVDVERGCCCCSSPLNRRLAAELLLVDDEVPVPSSSGFPTAFRAFFEAVLLVVSFMERNYSKSGICNNSLVGIVSKVGTHSR